MIGARVAQAPRAFWLTVAAFAWGAALVVAAFVVPVYGSASDSAPSGAPGDPASTTLVGVNGVGVVVPVAVPAVVAALVGLALHRKCSRGGRVSGIVAWSLIGALGAGCLVAILSIGLFAAPVAGLLAGAASLTPSGGARAERVVG